MQLGAEVGVVIFPPYHFSFNLPSTTSMDAQRTAPSSIFLFFFSRSIILHYRFLINWPSSVLNMLAVPCFLFRHPVQFFSLILCTSGPFCLGNPPHTHRPIPPPHNQPSVFPYHCLASFSNFYITPPSDPISPTPTATSPFRPLSSYPFAVQVSCGI